MPTLFVVATPIGNLSDVSERMLDTLRQVSLIAAEDTRVTGNLLRHFGITTPTTSLHRHNEAGKASGIIGRMCAEGIDVALVSDAGTPAVSDPGHLLVQEAIGQGMDVIPIPGPSAVIAAVSISGFDAREMTFYGFLPREHGDLVKKLRAIAAEATVAVVYESPHRVVDLFRAIVEVMPTCPACACCDLTKRYEKTLHGTADVVLAALEANPKTNKGEYCVVLNVGSLERESEDKIPAVSLEARLFDCVFQGQSPQEAVALLVAQGVRKNDAKRAMLRLRNYLEP